jgi:hypothetical protein
MKLINCFIITSPAIFNAAVPISDSRECTKYISIIQIKKTNRDLYRFVCITRKKRNTKITKYMIPEVFNLTNGSVAIAQYKSLLLQTDRIANSAISKKLPSALK